MNSLWQRLRWWLAGGLVLLVVAWRSVYWWTDYLWFQSLGYEAVLTRTWLTRAGLFVGGWALAYVVLLGGFHRSRRVDDTPSWADVDELAAGPLFWRALPFLLGVGALGYGWLIASLWRPFLLATHAVAAGTTDPVFGRDISFYLLQLPFWNDLYRYVFLLALVAWVLLYLRYIELPRLDEDQLVGGNLRGMAPGAVAHLSAVGAVVFALGAVGFWLARYNLVTTSRSNSVWGVAFTDAHVRLPLLGLLAAAALLAAGVLVANTRRPRLMVLGGAIVGVGLIMALGGLVPGFYQRLVVTPNEIAVERPYIERHIEATRQALALDAVADRQYTVVKRVADAEMAEHAEIIETIPLWSAVEMTAQLLGTETLRPYYELSGLVDFDRYRVDGRLQQVTVTAREMDADGLEPAAQTWVNEHLVYTHGYGLAMASAHDADASGGPVKLVRDIPPQTAPGLAFDEPALYYGETPADYIVTGLREDAPTREFDYPRSDGNAYTLYRGEGGVPMGSLLRRLVFAMRFRSVNLVVSRMTGPERRIHFRRELRPRLFALAPFLDYDSDPYPVLADGRVKWINDAYTFATRYPYGRPYDVFPAAALGAEQSDRFTRLQAAYMRNSVKAVMDAYDGSVAFHLVDPTCPVARTWQRVFPTLFTTDPLPGELARHIRYPGDLFALQARAFARYHMTSPEVFYNAEDLWDIAREETTVRERLSDGRYSFQSLRQRMTPYYVLLRLPGEDAPRFRLIVPFTPASEHDSGTGRDNMIGWMAADCDPESYGRLTVFAFPKNRLVVGPLQVEALIDQDPDISEQLTLWSQEGSRVLRGRLLVIPVGESLLYVEPLFLTAERRGALPELKRVVVYYNGTVAMADTLREALDDAIAGRRGPSLSVELLRLRRQAREADQALTAADAARRRGDLAAYGDALENLRRTLRTMSATGSGTPATAPEGLEPRAAAETEPAAVASVPAGE